MSEDYRQAIENAFALINVLGFSLVEMIDVLLAAGLPLAAAIASSSLLHTVVDYSQPVGVSMCAALRACETNTDSDEVAPRAAALYLWLARVALDRGLSADSELNAWRDHALQDEIRAATQASISKFPHWVYHTSTSASAFAETAVDTPVGWVVHVRYVMNALKFCAPRDIETAVVGYAMRGKIDPEFALGICLWVRINFRLHSRDSTWLVELATQAPSTAAALASALAHWCRPWPALVLPAVII